MTENLTSQVTISNAYDIISILLILAVILILLVVIIVIILYSTWLVKKYLKLRKLKKQEKQDRKLVGGDVYAAARRASRREAEAEEEEAAGRNALYSKGATKLSVKSSEVVESGTYFEKINFYKKIVKNPF